MFSMLTLSLLNLTNHALRSSRILIQSFIMLVTPPTGGSAGKKKSACNTGDPDSIPVLGRSPGEGIGYPLQYSWASLVAQMVKNPPAMWDTWV